MRYTMRVAMPPTVLKRNRRLWGANRKLIVFNDRAIVQWGDVFPFPFRDILVEASRYGYGVIVIANQRSASQCHTFIQDAESVGIPTMVIFDHCAHGMSTHGARSTPPSIFPVLLTETLRARLDELRGHLISWAHTEMPSIQAPQKTELALSFLSYELAAGVYTCYIINVADAEDWFRTMEARRFVGDRHCTLRYMAERERRTITDQNFLSRVVDSMNTFLKRSIETTWRKGAGLAYLNGNKIVIGLRGMISKEAVVIPIARDCENLCFVAAEQDDFPVVLKLSRMNNARCVLAQETHAAPKEIIPLVHSCIPQRAMGALVLRSDILGTTRRE